MALDRYNERSGEGLSQMVARKQYNLAIDVLRTRLRQRPPDPRTRLRLADLLVQAGRGQEAIPILLALADDFGNGGFVAKAVAVLKRVERIRPNLAEVNRRLDGLALQPELALAVPSSVLEAEPAAPFESARRAPGAGTPVPPAPEPEEQEPAAPNETVVLRIRGLLGRLLGGRGESPAPPRGSPEATQPGQPPGPAALEGGAELDASAFLPRSFTPIPSAPASPGEQQGPPAVEAPPPEPCSPTQEVSGAVAPVVPPEATPTPELAAEPEARGEAGFTPAEPQGGAGGARRSTPPLNEAPPESPAPPASEVPTEADAAATVAQPPPAPEPSKPEPPPATPAAEDDPAPEGRPPESGGLRSFLGRLWGRRREEATPPAPVWTVFPAAEPASPMKADRPVTPAPPEATPEVPPSASVVESEAHGGAGFTPPPEATPEVQARVSVVEPEAHGGAGFTPPPEATPEVKASASVIESEAHGGAGFTPPPEATPEVQARVSVVESEAHGGAGFTPPPEVQARVSVVEPEAHGGAGFTPPPEVQARVSVVEPEAHGGAGFTPAEPWGGAGGVRRSTPPLDEVQARVSVVESEAHGGAGFTPAEPWGGAGGVRRSTPPLDDVPASASVVEPDTPPAAAPPEAVAEEPCAATESLPMLEPDPEPVAAAAEPPLSEIDFHERLLDVVQEALVRQSPEATEPIDSATAIDTRRLQASPLLVELDDDELRQLVRDLQLRTCEPGDIVLSEGEPGETLFLLVSGTVKVFVRNPNSRNVEVHELGEGDFFGEVGFLSGRPRMATVIAASALELLELERPALERLAQVHPGMLDMLEAYYLARTQSDAAATLRSAAIDDPDVPRRAAEVLKAHFGEAHWDPRMRLKLAEALLKSGKQQEALPILAGLADELVRAGYTEKAVAILKRIERIEGRHTEQFSLAPLKRAATPAPPAPTPAAPRAESEGGFNGWLLELVRKSVERGQTHRRPASAPGLLMSPLFEGFSEEELLSLVRGLRLLEYDTGDVIISEGEYGDSVFVLTAGLVKVFVRNTLGHNVLVGRLAEGDFFGEISLLSGRPRSATITSASPCELLELDKPTLERVCAEHPRVRSVMEEIYIERASHPLAARVRAGAGSSEG